MVASRASWSDEQVRDFVAGRMDAAASAQLSAQVQHDLALAGRVARERALRRGAAPAGVAPMPPAVAPADVAPVVDATPERSEGRPPSAAWWILALLAMLLAGFAGWWLARPGDAPLVADDNGLRAAHRLEQALSTRIAAEGSTSEGVLVSLSFKASDGRYCRTFSLDVGMDGLACHDGREWRVEAIGRSPEVAPSGDGGVRLPSPSLSPSVLSAISRWQAGNALTPEEERRVREPGWQ